MSSSELQKQLKNKSQEKTSLNDLPRDVLHEIKKRLSVRDRVALSLAKRDETSLPPVFPYDKTIKNIIVTGNKLTEDGDNLIKELELLIMSKPYAFTEENLPIESLQKLFKNDIKKLIKNLLRELQIKEELFNKVQSMTPIERGAYVIKNIRIPQQVFNSDTSDPESEDLGPASHGEEIRSAFSRAVRTFGEIVVGEKDLQQLSKMYQKGQEWRDRNRELHTITEQQALKDVIRMLKSKGVRLV